jgi:hypothetical protein
MSRAAWSMFLFGSYLVVAGSLLVLVPDVVASVLGFQRPGHGIWVRLSGMLILNLSYFCFWSARTEQKEFMRWSVVTRSANLFFIWVFVAFAMENRIFLLFGFLDLFGALWTGFALLIDRAAEEHGGREVVLEAPYERSKSV